MVGCCPLFWEAETVPEVGGIVLFFRGYGTVACPVPAVGITSYDVLESEAWRVAGIGER